MKGVRKCKVCGADYEYCYTVRQNSDVFRYQDVACCPEHGSIYFRQVLEARGELPVIADGMDIDECDDVDIDKYDDDFAFGFNDEECEMCIL